MKRLLHSLLLLLASSSLHAQVYILRKQITDIIRSANADIGIAVKVLEENDTLTINGSKHYPMQSVFKFPQAMAMLHQVDKGKFKLDQKIGLKKSDYFPTHSPLAKKYPEGSSDVTLKEMLEATVSFSDNVGCDVMFRLFGGPKEVEKYIHSLGVKDLAIVYNEKEMHSDWNIPFKNWSTPFAMLQLLELFQEGKKLSPASFDLLWNAMATTPTGPKRIRAGVPQQFVVAHKTGTGSRNEQGVVGALNDAAIIVLPDGRHLALVIFVTNSLQSDSYLEGIMAEVSKTVFAFYSGNGK